MSSFSPAGISRTSAQHRWYVIGIWILVLIAAGFSASTLLPDSLTAEFENYSNQDSKVGQDLLEARMGYDDPQTETIVVNSTDLTVDDAGFADVVNATVGDLRGATDFVDPEGVLNYYELIDSGNPDDADTAAQLVSEDRMTLIVPVTLVGTLDDTQDHVDEYLDILSANSTDDVEVLSVGSMTINDTFSTISEEDLATGEKFGIPIALIILIIVFGALVAAFVPILLALVAIPTALGMAGVFGNFRDLSFFITNMITTIGLAVGIDYSLFVIDRYREERRKGRSTLDAISAAGGTATKAVCFSGLTVVFALLGLFIVPNSIFQSLGLGAILVVIAAVCAVLTLIPVVVSLLGRWLDWPRHPHYDAESAANEQLRDAEVIHSGFWGTITKTVMGHPWPFVIGAAGLLILLALPYRDMETGLEGVDRMPDTPVKQAFVLLDDKFAAGQLAPVDIVIDGQNTDEVNASIDTLKASISDDDGFASVGPTEWGPNNDLAHFQATLAMDSNSDAAYDQIELLRSDLVPAAFDGTDATVYVAGDTAANQDFFDLVDQRTPWVFAFVLGLSFLLLLVAFRSLVVPATAIVMNLLSVGAAYGLLVLVFQKGYLTDFFGFQETPRIEAWIPLFLFCVLFGLSMDYQVFLLSRIRENYDRTGDNDFAVAAGLQSTARLITGAAAIMVVVFAGFAAGQLSSFQQMGFGLAAAIAIDATVVRSILVPATMKILGDRNWYFPSWLEWLPDIRIEGEPAQATPEDPREPELVPAD